jgi:peroxiredoxin Q/BCP
LNDSGAVIVGMSDDQTATLDAWIRKLDYPYVLVSNTDHSTLDAYGVWGEREWQGRKYMGILRTSFLIGADGVVERVWENVKPGEHAREVVEALRAA